MSQLANLEAPRDTDQALRSLVSALEFSSQIIAKLSSGVAEKSEAESKINEALIACHRMNLQNKIAQGS